MAGGGGALSPASHLQYAEFLVQGCLKGDVLTILGVDNILCKTYRIYQCHCPVLATPLSTVNTTQYSFLCVYSHRKSGVFLETKVSEEKLLTVLRGRAESVKENRARGNISLNAHRGTCTGVGAGAGAGSCGDGGKAQRGALRQLWTPS